MPATPNCNICYMLVTMCLYVKSSWYEYAWFEIINPGNARVCLGLHVGTYGGCVVHVVVGGEWVVVWVAATLYSGEWVVVWVAATLYMQTCIRIAYKKTTTTKYIQSTAFLLSMAVPTLTVRWKSRTASLYVGEC